MVLSTFFLQECFSRPVLNVRSFLVGSVLKFSYDFLSQNISIFVIFEFCNIAVLYRSTHTAQT